MIQRIQTVYLLIIVLLSGFTIFSPVADLLNTASGLTYIINLKGIYLVQGTENIYQSSVWSLSMVSLLIPFLSIITILTYKDRIKQIRFSVINMLLMIGFYVLLFLYLWLGSKNLNADWHLRTVCILPLISIVFNYLAIGAIGKDEALVKSMDRIR
jgi:uncharacterized membrane protein YhhN